MITKKGCAPVINWFINYKLVSIDISTINHSYLSGAKRREWMGKTGLLGLLLIVSQWIIPENSLRKTHQKKFH